MDAAAPTTKTTNLDDDLTYEELDDLALYLGRKNDRLESLVHELKARCEHLLLALTQVNQIADHREVAVKVHQAQSEHHAALKAWDEAHPQVPTPKARP